jgi:hypothetical protein
MYLSIRELFIERGMPIRPVREKGSAYMQDAQEVECLIRFRSAGRVA